MDISSYGKDHKNFPSLGKLATEILHKVKALKRLRVTSLDPAFVDDELLQLMANEDRFMPHLHLSLQAADDMVLKRMKRRHTRDTVIDLVKRARMMRPDVIFGADLIAGFPTESERMFKNTLSAVNDMGLTYLHVFPYSSRPGTPASKMPAVKKDLISERARLLREAGDLALRNYLKSKLGKSVEVLVEKNHKGHTRHFASVDLNFDAPVGSIVKARAIAVDEKKGRLIAGFEA